MTNEPFEIVAGDRVQWTRSFSDYKASAGWGLRYVLINSASKITIEASASGDDFAVDLAPATTAAYAAGRYDWQAYAWKAGDRALVDSGSITIKPNFEGSSTYDARSHVKKTLDALEATIEGKASLDQLEYTIGDRQLKRLSPEELILWRDKYLAYYRQEQAAERVNNGYPARNRILTRFTKTC